MLNSFKNVLFLLIAGLLVFSLTKNIFEYNKKIDFYNSFKNSLNELEDENKKLKSDIAKSKDLNNIEKIIREKLNLSKPGEMVVILPEEEIIPTPTPIPIKPSYRQWIELFL